MKEKIIALIGNPNAGKTTLFNSLTGSSAKVGNWSGVTVEKKEGILLGQEDLKIIDLPGIYSLSAYSDDERIARDFLLEKPDLVVDILDASNLKRNLYLTLQLLEMNQHVLLAMNLMDVAGKKYEKIDLTLLSSLLGGIPVLPVTGHRGEGIEALAEAIRQDQGPLGEGFRVPYGTEIEFHLERLERLFQEKGVAVPGYTHRLLAIQSLEGNEGVRERLKAWGLQEQILEEARHLQSLFKDELEMVFIERRYGFIQGLLKKILVRRKTLENKLDLAEQVDKVVLHPVAGIFIFLGVMFLLFQTTFLLGDVFKGVLEAGVGRLSALVAEGVSNPVLASFLADGLLGGVGTIVTFLPNLILMFLLLSFLEDIGYMSRAAYLMDRFMRFFGLQGKAFIPLITGFGCTVPAVLSARTLESRGDRMTTIMVTPLISCSARLPIYVLFITAFFPEQQGTALFLIYIMGILLAVVMAKVFRKFLFSSPAAPFVLELPPYRIPTAKAMWIHTWERVWEFLARASTVILGMVIVIWALSILPLGVEYAGRESLIGILGSLMAPLLAPLGFGTYEAAAALLSGIVAKEVVVSTLATIYGTSAGSLSQILAESWTALQGAAFMVMSAIYIPCIATLATIRQETRSWGWMLFAAAYTVALGYLAALLIYQGGRLLGLG